MPQSLKDKADAVKNAGGVATLAKLVQELPELLTRNTEILDEADRMLREEKESDDKVWATNSNFSFFCKNISQSMTPGRAEYCSLPFLPATSSAASQTLEEFFKLTQRPSRALNSPRELLLDLQRCKEGSDVQNYARRSQDTVNNS